MRRKIKQNNTGFLSSIFKIPLWAFVIIMVVIAIILILVSIDKNGYWYQVANVLGTTLLATAVVSIVLEYSSIKSTVNAAIKNMLEGDINLDSFSDNSLNRFGKKVAIQRSKLDIKEDDLDRSIYTLESQLLGLLDNTYYEYHNSTIYLNPDKDKNVIHKKVKMDYLIMNKYENENYIDHEFLVFNNPDDKNGDNWKENISINNFRINDTDLTNEAKSYLRIEKIPPKEHKYYQSKISFYRKLQDCKKHKVKLEFEYDIPITDNIQAFKVVKPAKRLEHTFIMTNEENAEKLGFSANAFTSFYCSEGEKFKIEAMNDTDVKIRFEDWIIPGAGYVVIIKKI